MRTFCHRFIPFLILAFSANAFALIGGVPQPWPWQNPGYYGPQQAPLAPPVQQYIQQQAVPPPYAPPPQPDPSAQILQQMLSNIGGGRGGKKGLSTSGPDDGADLANGLKSSYGYKVQAATDGRMESCTMPPPQVLQAFEEAKKFRDDCAPAQRGENQRVVINDFHSKSRSDIPYMYIFDLNGKCLGKTAVSYGNGIGPTVPEGCSDANHHLTPPGFHLTAYHNSAAYPSRYCLGMVSLEGQNSQKRGILIHPAKSPGTASSWGCAGVGSFDQVKRALGEGALVYNYFGDKDKANGCYSSAGIKHDGKRCRLEQSEKAIPETATGQGTPAMK